MGFGRPGPGHRSCTFSVNGGRFDLSDFELARLYKEGIHQGSLGRNDRNRTPGGVSAE